MCIAACVVVVVAIILIGLAAAGRLRKGSSSNPYVSEETEQGVQRIINAALDPSKATFVYDRIADITDTFGPRLSGTQALEDAMTYMKGMMVKDGLVTREEGPVYVTNWVRGNEYARMILPRNKTLHMLGVGNSNRTYMANGQPGPIRAEVLVVTSFNDLTAKAALAKGKIVVFNYAWDGSYSTTVVYRSQGAVRAAAVGAVGALIRSVTPFSMQNPHTGSGTTSTIAAAAITVEDALQLQRLQNKGKTIEIEFYMEAQFLPLAESRNLVCLVEGHELPNEYVIIGGHIDSWDVAEGAMDDLGGGVISWEAVHLIQSTGLRPRRSIWAVQWTNEENGVAGGNAFAQLHAPQLINVSIAIESDSGVFLPYGLGFTGSPQAMKILQSISYLLKPLGSGNVVTSGGGGVDITPMCNTGVPCGSFNVLDFRGTQDTNNMCLPAVPPMSNGEASQLYGGYFWYHHTEADTIDKLDPNQLQRASAAMAIWAYAIANLPDLLPR